MKTMREVTTGLLADLFRGWEADRLRQCIAMLEEKAAAEGTTVDYQQPVPALLRQELANREAAAWSDDGAFMRRQGN